MLAALNRNSACCCPCATEPIRPMQTASDEIHFMLIPCIQILVGVVGRFVGGQAGVS